MQTRPIEPAQLRLSSDPAEPSGTGCGDRFATGPGALSRARALFLQGNALPARWAGRSHFVVLETGFGLGHNFLATWDAWRRDPARCERLHCVSVEPHPPSLADLTRGHEASGLPDLAAALVQAWPALTANLHLLEFEQGRVQLTLVLGEVATLLPALRLQADALYLEAFAAPHQAQRWTPQFAKAVARLSAPGATLAAGSASPELHACLRSAGFVLREATGPEERRLGCQARFAPRFQRRSLPALAVDTRTAIVVGAGLAGAAAAQALARQGLRVTVFEREALPAQGASGNPAGLFHGTVNADDGTYARLFRAAALAAASTYREAIDGGQVPGGRDGLLRLAAHPSGLPGLRALLQARGLPPGYVQALDAPAASALAGVSLPEACWFYPDGGWLSPAAWVGNTLQSPGIELRSCSPVQQLVRHGSGWRLYGDSGQVLAQAPLVVLANAADASRLLAALGHAPWPLRHSRGQVTHWSTPETSALKRPVAGDGYALPLPQGLLCGATRQDGDADPGLREADHCQNLERLKRLTGLEPPSGVTLLQGRVGWRLQADDRLPIAGAVPQAGLAAPQRLDQARLLPREQGLFVLTALGARGITLAPLLARLVAAQASGSPWPLEQDLADAVDPARWIVRAARRQAGPGQAG